MTVYALEDLILMKEGVLPCRHCGELTRWRVKGQSTKGVCWDHVRYQPLAETDELDVVDAMAEAFPGSLVTYDWMPPRYVPDEYGRDVKLVVTGQWYGSGHPIWSTVMSPPPDAGPCEGCRRTIRRYGDLAYPRCTECDELEGLKK
jgi:hypothetical protein